MTNPVEPSLFCLSLVPRPTHLLPCLFCLSLVPRPTHLLPCLFCLSLVPRPTHLLPCLFCLFVFRLSPDNPICYPVCSAYLYSAWGQTVPYVALPFCLSVFSLRRDSPICCPVCSAYLYSDWAQTAPSVALSVTPISIQPEARQSHLLLFLFCLSVFSLRRDSPICCPVCSDYLFSAWAQTQSHLLPCLFCLFVFCLRP